MLCVRQLEDKELTDILCRFIRVSLQQVGDGFWLKKNIRVFFCPPCTHMVRSSSLIVAVVHRITLSSCWKKSVFSVWIICESTETVVLARRL